MKTTKYAVRKDKSKAIKIQGARQHFYCELPQTPIRELGSDVSPHRASLIQIMAKKWVNGTVLTYYFFDKSTDGRNAVLVNGSTQWRTWTASDGEKNIVRAGFKAWTDLSMGVQFKEVKNRDDAQIRIGFERGDGAWSYVGRDIVDLGIGADQRTMNFGWQLTGTPPDLDTAIHEIGHSLGFPHEHQNPNAGLVWDEEAVYRSLAQPPNNWPREKTFHNIIRKIPPDTVQGSSWDPDSIMHYPFEGGLIKEPAQYRLGLQPAGGISQRDKTWVNTFYPPMKSPNTELKPFKSIDLQLAAGEQKNLLINPTSTRYYEIRTFGTSDTVMVLLEAEADGDLIYKTADDDSGEDRNAYLRIKLFKGKSYVLRIRLYYAEKTDETAVMLW